MADPNPFNTFRQDDRFRPFYGFENLPLPPLAQQLLAPIAQSYAGNYGMMPLGLSGRNTMSRLDEMRMTMLHSRMLQQAAEADRDTYMAQLRGMAAITGTPWDATRQNAARSLADRMVGAAPFMSSMAPEFLDAMGGYRGSTTVMADFAFQGARLRMDPVTGGVGLSQSSLDRMLGMMQNRLSYDREGGQLTSLSLGETGRLFQALQKQGLVRTGAADMVPKEVGTAARDLGIDISKGVDRLSDTDFQRLTAQPGVAQSLQTLDSSRVVDTLKRYQGAIAAVREIFGDAGRPNAPMAELVASLNTLSSGGLGQIDPSRLGQLVRTNYSLAQKSGLGLENVLMFQETLAQQARAMGLPTPYAATTTQAALAYGQAYQATGYGGVPVFGQGNLDFQRALFAQQRMAAAGSPMANQLGMLMRLRDVSGGNAFRPGSEAALMVEQIGSDVAPKPMSDPEFVRMLERSGQGRFSDASMIRDMLQMRQANQEYAFKYGADGLVHRAQRGEMIRFLKESSSFQAQTAARSAGFGDQESLHIAGLLSDTFGEELAGMSPEQYGDPVRRSQLLGRAMLTRLTGDAVGERFLNAYGRDELSVLAGNMYGASERNRRAFGRGDKGSLANMLTQHNPRLQAAMTRILAAESSMTRLREAMDPFNRGGVMANAVQALIETKTDDPDALAKVLLRSVGAADRQDLIGQLRGGMTTVQEDLAEWQKLHAIQQGRGLTDDQKKLMLEKEKGIRDAYSTRIMPFLESSGLLYRSSLVPENFALYARQANYLDRFRRRDGGTDEATARAAAKMQIQLVDQQLEAISMDPNFLTQYGAPAQKQLAALRESTEKLNSLATAGGMSLAEMLTRSLTPDAAGELKRQHAAMSWFLGVSRGEGTEKPFGWLYDRVGGLEAAFGRVSKLTDKDGKTLAALSSLQSVLTMGDAAWKGFTDVAAGDRAVIDTAREAYAKYRDEVETDQAKRAGLLKSSLKDAATIFRMGDVEGLDSGMTSMLKSRPDIASRFISGVAALKKASGLLTDGKEAEALKLLRDAGISEDLLPSSSPTRGGLKLPTIQDFIKSLPGAAEALKEEQASRETTISVNVARIEMKDEGMKISGDGIVQSPSRVNV